MLEGVKTILRYFLKDRWIALRTDEVGIGVADEEHRQSKKKED